MLLEMYLPIFASNTLHPAPSSAQGTMDSNPCLCHQAHVLQVFQSVEVFHSVQVELDGIARRLQLQVAVLQPVVEIHHFFQGVVELLQD